MARLQRKESVALMLSALTTLPAIVAIGWWLALCFGHLKAATFG